MRDLGRDGVHPNAAERHLVQQTCAVRAVGQHGAGMVVDLDCIGEADPAGSLQRQSVPVRVGDGDEGTGILRARGEAGAGLMRGGQIRRAGPCWEVRVLSVR